MCKCKDSASASSFIHSMGRSCWSLPHSASNRIMPRPCVVPYMWRCGVSGDATLLKVRGEQAFSLLYLLLCFGRNRSSNLLCSFWRTFPSVKASSYQSYQPSKGCCDFGVGDHFSNQSRVAFSVKQRRQQGHDEDRAGYSRNGLTVVLQLYYSQQSLVAPHGRRSPWANPVAIW